jgi:hypothetical protein
LDNSLEGFAWKTDASAIYFYGAVDGTRQLFEITSPLSTTAAARKIRQVTHGEFDINEIAGIAGNKMVVSRTDMNHAAELFLVDLSAGSMTQLTHINDAFYARIGKSKVEQEDMYLLPTIKKCWFM